MVRVSPRLQKKACNQPLKNEPAEENSKSETEIRRLSFDKDESNAVEVVDCVSKEVTVLEVPQHIVKMEEDIAAPNDANNPSSQPETEPETFESIKCELNIKEEPDVFVEDDNFPRSEFSKYEHLLENITFLKNDGDIQFDESSHGSTVDDDPDDPDYDDEEEEDDVFSCFNCDFTCELKSEFAAHLLVHKGKATLKCEFCEDVFAKPAALQVHLATKHPEENQDETLIFKCRFCKRKFSTTKQRSTHIHSAHSDKAKHQCSHCSKKFIRKSGLEQHMRFHLDSRPFKCKICNTSFRTKGNKETHMKQHFGFREYQCDQCGKDFIRKDQLKRHILTVHKKTCLYKCSICNRSLKGHVLNHLRIHMDEKQFKCTECGKSFVQSSQLTVHMRTHTGDKPYLCTFCSATFSHSSACRLHMRIHTGEKPAKCQLCPAAFTQLPHLKKHMRCIHKADKPYVCVPCKEFFKTQAELRSHTSAKKCKKNTSPKPKKTSSGKSV